MEKIIEFKNVSKIYDSETHALNNVNVAIEKGEFAFIVGASGAGKSTFLKLIMHEETPTEGTIIVNGTDVTKLRRNRVPYLRRNMGIVFQDFRLIEKMTIYDNVAFAMRAIGASPAEVKKRVPYILGLVGLSHKLKNRPSELSGGEQQRVSLARALVNNPAIIIADEPTGNIDPEMSYDIIDLLSEINKEGTTIIVVTHEHDLVRQFNKRVIEIEKGQVVNDTRAGDFEIDLTPEEESKDSEETSENKNVAEDSDTSDNDINEDNASESANDDAPEDKIPEEEIPEEEIPEEEKDIKEEAKAETETEAEKNEEEAEGETEAEQNNKAEPESSPAVENVTESEKEAGEESAPESASEALDSQADEAFEADEEKDEMPEEKELTVDEILASISLRKDTAKVDDLTVDEVLAELREHKEKGGEE